MQEFKIKMTQKEYLEIKRNALLDREKYIAELDAKKDEAGKSYKAKQCIVETCADEYDYVDEARRAYCSNFLIPDDFKFAEYHEKRQSRSACKDHFDVSFEVIQDKFLFSGMFGKYRDLSEVEAALASLEIEGQSHNPETLELDDDTIEKTKTADEMQSEASKLFFPIDHFEVSDNLPNKEDDNVERETAAALEKINHLFQRNDTKDERIRTLEQEKEEKMAIIADLQAQLAAKEDVITALETKIMSLKKQNVLLEEKVDDLNVRNIGLEEENKSLREYHRKIVDAINEKYCEEEDTHKKRV